MRSENRKKREAEIEAAAYDLFAENGYAGTSMLAIAKQARASNETLYRWYGDKLGLFRAMIASNAEWVAERLKRDMSAEQPPLEILAVLGPRLLSLLLGDRAVALNRIAAANTGQGLGKALAEAGRNTIAPMIAETFASARSEGHFPDLEVVELTETYIALLVGDLQIRRVTDAIPPLTKSAITLRSEQVLKTLHILGGSK